MGIYINHAKGIATPLSAPHTYKLKEQSVLIKSKKITEEEDRTEDIKKTEGPQNIRETKKSTVFEVFDTVTNVKIVLITLDGDKGDEDCLALMGYYLTTYDEKKEAEKMRRLMDISRFL